jgi:hypothetical protein
MNDSGSERTLAVNGLRLACKFWGEPDALPTLALHGWLDNAASFDAIGQQLRSATWQADIKEIGASGDSYRGRLQVKKAGA